MATARRPPTGPDIPDLDIGPAPSGPPRGRNSGTTPAVSVPSTPSPRVSAPPVSARGPADYFGAGNFEDTSFGDDMSGQGASIALDTDGGHGSHGIQISHGAGAADSGDLDLYEKSAANAQSVQSVRPVPGSGVAKKKWPTGISPDLAAIELDSVEIAVTASYGDSPSSILLAPSYAVRVLLQRRTLDAKLKELKQSFDEANAKRDEALVLMVRELRGKILLTEQGDALFEPIVAAEKIGLERRAALAGTNAEYEKENAELAERAATADREVDQCRKTIDQRTNALAELSRSFERLDAKKKRLYIELTGLVALSEKSGGKLTPEQQSSVARLEADIASQKPALDSATAAAEAGRAVLASAQAEYKKAELRAREIDKRRQAVEDDFKKRIGARNDGIAEADSQRVAAFASVARKVLAERGRLVDVPPDILEAVERRDREVLARATELEKYARARGSYDSEAVTKGLGVIGAVVVAILVALVVLLKR